MSDDSKPFRPLSSEIHAQKQPYPAVQSRMNPLPADDLKHYKPAGKLQGKRALITGGDSGIGRSVAIAFAKEGADVAIVYNENTKDAEKTRDLVQSAGGKCFLIQADIRTRKACFEIVATAVEKLGGLNVLVNNAAYQTAQEKFEDYTEEEIKRAFDTNIFATMFLSQAALPHLHQGDSIINTGSIVGIVGIGLLVPYSATKAAIHAFTKSLALSIGDRGIRVNCVVPGPVWTPNIPGTMPASEVENFGHEVIMKRPGQPEELAPAFVYFASDDSSFCTGSQLEVTGGRIG